MSKEVMSVSEFVAKQRKELTSKKYSSALAKELVLKLLNDPEFTSKSVKVVDGKATIVENHPVKKMRKVIMNVLVDYGVDAKEAETILTTYNFKSKDVEGVIDFINEFVVQYLLTGKKYKLAEREDFNGSLFLDDVAEVTKKFSKNDYETTVKAHKKLKSKSSAPKWKKVKHQKGKDGKVIDIAAMELFK